MKMHSKLCLDPSVILNPLSFAIHIAALGESSLPLGIPAAWLWEELQRRYSLITLADLFLWLGNDIDRCMGIPIHMDQYAAPDASVAMLLAARHLGYVIPVATTHSRRQFDHGDWSSYLSSALGNEWEELEDNKRIADATWTTAVEHVARDKGFSISDLETLYARNERFDTRTAQEYPIYERLRYLAVILFEIVVGLDAGKSVSTPSPSIRNCIVHDFSRHEGMFVPPKEIPFQPLIEKVILKNEDATVRDIFAITGLTRLGTLLGGADALSKIISHEIRRRELVKETAMYLLGLVPLIGNAVTAVEGVELIQTLWKTRKNNSEHSSGALLYFSSTRCGAKLHDESSGATTT